MLLMEQRMRFLMIRLVMVICREEGTRKGGLSYAPQGIGDEIVTDSTSNGNGNGTSRKNVVVTNSGPRSTSESSQNLSLTEGKKQLSCEWIHVKGKIMRREEFHPDGDESALYMRQVGGSRECSDPYLDVNRIFGRNYEASNVGDTQENQGHEEHKDNPTPKPSNCKFRRFEMMKYSFNDDEEYITIKESEYLNHSKDSLDAYRELLRLIDEGWVVTTPDE
ncbi:hypothetical protein Tco_0087233 [Tanacetum coccineum]